MNMIWSCHDNHSHYLTVTEDEGEVSIHADWSDLTFDKGFAINLAKSILAHFGVASEPVATGDSEPWEVDGSPSGPQPLLRDSHGVWLATFGSHSDLEHAAACVNALAGLKPDSGEVKAALAALRVPCPGTENRR